MPKDSLQDYIVDHLRELGPVRWRAMFGGHGLLYHGVVFFGILYRGRLYFKTDATSRRDYRAHGMQPFRPNARQTLKNYFEVPAEILDDPDQLTAWAQLAIRLR